MEKIIKPVFWTSRAVKDLEKITRFNILLYGFEKSIGIALEIQKTTEILENSAMTLVKLALSTQNFFT